MTETATHTPGPWAVVCQEFDDKSEGIGVFAIPEAPEFRGKTVRGLHPLKFICVLPMRAERDANANLIAAAPELLEALTRLLYDVDLERVYNLLWDAGFHDDADKFYVVTHRAMAVEKMAVGD